MRPPGGVVPLEQTPTLEDQDLGGPDAAPGAAGVGVDLLLPAVAPGVVADRVEFHGRSFRS